MKPAPHLERAVRIGMLLGVSAEIMRDVLECQPHELAGTIAKVQAQRPPAPQLREVQP